MTEITTVETIAENKGLELDLKLKTEEILN